MIEGFGSNRFEEKNVIFFRVLDQTDLGGKINQENLCSNLDPTSLKKKVFF